MKKKIVLAMASVLCFAMTAMPVMAASSPSAAAIVSRIEAAAQSAGMTVGEYNNNAVVSTPGITNAIPVGQGGKILINGVMTNATVTLGKVDKATAEAAYQVANELGGTLLNAVTTKIPRANFNVATVTFYMPKVVAGQKIAVKQKTVDDWVDVTVAEVRDDHVTVDMTASGTICFILEP